MIDIIEKSREWFTTASKSEEENRHRAQESIDFRVGDQWDADVLQQRKDWKLPSMTFNQCDVLISRVASNIIQSLPFMTVIPEEESDLIGARSVHKIIKHIERVNDAESIYQNLTEDILDGGFGYYRIFTKFSDYDTFDQEIVMKYIPNRFTVYFDPAAKEDTYEDAKYVIITEVVEREEFEDQYGEDKWDEFYSSDTNGTEFEKWFFDNKIRVAEVYWKEPVKKKWLRLLNQNSGSELVVDEDDIEKLSLLEQNGYEVIDEREGDGFKVMWAKITGTEFLEDKIEIDSDFIPVIKAVGKRENIRGKEQLYSLIDNVKAPQQLLNYTLTTETIMVSIQPKAIWQAAEDLVEGYEDTYASSHHENIGLLMYKRNPAFPADKPELLPPPKSSQGYLNLVEFANQQIENTSGVTEALLGKKSNEVSGKAIQTRAAGSEMVNAVFGRNVLKAIAYGGRIMVNMIGRIYNDIDKVVRVLGEQDGFEYITVNNLVIDPESGEVNILNDVSKNKYDYIVEASSNFKTKRRENVANFFQMLQLAQNNPAVSAFIMSEIARNMDIDNAPGLAEKFLQLSGLAGAQGSPPNIEGNQDVTESAEARQTAVTPQGG
jgi:hypothetical protein